MPPPPHPRTGVGERVVHGVQHDDGRLRRRVLRGERGDVSVGDQRGPHPDRFAFGVQLDVAHPGQAGAGAVTFRAAVTGAPAEDHLDLLNGGDP
jgi:hypothetical protein